MMNGSRLLFLITTREREREREREKRPDLFFLLPPFSFSLQLSAGESDLYCATNCQKLAFFL